jgi:molybdenum cofactor guanylyltransferase
MATLCGAILAGGRGRRMAADKTQMRRDGQRVLERTAALLAPLCGRVLLVARDEAQAAELRSVCAVETIVDAQPGLGPMGGLHAALKHTGGDVLLVACDMPFLEAALLGRMIESFRTRCAPVAAMRTLDEQKQWRVEPLCAVWSQSVLPQVEQAIATQRLSMTRLTEELGAAFVDLSAAEALQLRNINSPAELQQPDARLEI